MIHVTTPENSKIIKYSFTPLGSIVIYSLNPKTDSNKSLLTDGANALGTDVIQTEVKPKGYQSVLASIFIGEQTTLNIDYVNYPKSVQKPNKFDVSSQRVLTFK